jgi:hypothetical protein
MRSQEQPLDNLTKKVYNLDEILTQNICSCIVCV